MSLENFNQPNANEEIISSQTDVGFVRENLVALLEDYIPGIPEDVIHSDSHGATHKAQKTWFHMVIWTMDTLFAQQIISVAPNLAREAKKFKHFVTGRKFEGRLTTMKDQRRANRLMRRTLRLIEEWNAEEPFFASQTTLPLPKPQRAVA